MKNLKFILLVVFTLSFVTLSFSQKGSYRITNGFNIFGGITEFDIITDNFETSKERGFMGSIMASVDLPHKWYNLSYGIQLSENNMGILAKPEPSSTNTEFVDFKLLTAQLGMFMHVKLIPDYLTIDFGPLLQYNGALEFKDKNKEGYFVNGYNNLAAKDIINISKFNVNAAIGASVGIKHIKFKAQYIYGFTNILGALDNENLDTTGGKLDFNGNQSLLFLGAIISF